MKSRKNLGMGLDLLLSSANSQVAQSNDNLVLIRNRINFKKALAEDEKGNKFEAYHLYRKVVDCLEDLLSSSANPPEIYFITSQALNNAAVILYEDDRLELARSFLQKAIEIWPENTTAIDNLNLI